MDFERVRSKMPPFTFPVRTLSFGPFDTPSGTSSKNKDRASVFVWGWGSQGQLGIGDPASRLAPVSVSLKVGLLV
jgi:hypothetical protein